MTNILVSHLEEKIITLLRDRKALEKVIPEPYYQKVGQGPIGESQTLNFIPAILVLEELYCLGQRQKEDFKNLLLKEYIYQ